MEAKSISLNKFISNTGFCSRREADKLIKCGRVKIDGAIASPGNRVISPQIVTIDEEPIILKVEKIYLAFHKPVGISSTTDLKDKNNIIDYR